MESIILASPDVITAADEAFRCLRALRDRISQSESLAQYEPVLEDYASRLDALRNARRHDLGAQGNSPQIPL